MSPIRTGHHDRSCLTLMLLAALAGCTHDTGTPTAITLSAATVLTSGTPTILQADVLPPRTLASVIPSHHKRGPELRQAPETRPISAQGIRGDVLAQALRTETNHKADGQTRFTQAMPWSEEQSEPSTARPVFHVDQRIDTDHSLNLGAYVYSTRSFTEGGKHHQPALALKLGLSARGKLPASPDRQQARSSTSRADGELLQIGRHVQMQLGSGPDQGQHRPVVSIRVAARSALSLRGHERFTWDTPIQTWGKPDADHVELNVIAGRSQREFGLCLTARLDTLYRRQNCSLWQVPAGWQPGQPLHYQGQYIQEIGLIPSGQTGKTPLYQALHWLTPAGRVHVASERPSQTRQASSNPRILSLLTR